MDPWWEKLAMLKLSWLFYKVGSSVVRTLHLAQKNWVRSPWQAEYWQWKSHWKIIQGLGKRQALNYDHDLDIGSSILMAFMSKAGLNTIDCKFFNNLRQSLVSSMVEFWLCVQRNWVQSPEVPSHWNSAVSKEMWAKVSSHEEFRAHARTNILPILFSALKKNQVMRFDWCQLRNLIFVWGSPG